MLDADGKPMTAHTLNPVPAAFAGDAFRGKRVRGGEARLADVAPTVLLAMGLPVPAEMTGRPLVE
jgi:2,3-bisphosphoglycerate-independent phosphoglycerate mutase